MIVNDLRPRGYCHGVAKALHLVKKAILDDTLEKPIYILGLIVHNKKIKEALSHYGVITLNGESRIDMARSVTQGTVILSAHGVSNTVKEILNEKAIHTIDATCKDVYKVHDHILSHLSTHEVLYIGKPLHPEVEGVLGLSDEITLIDSLNTATSYIKQTSKPIYITNQTTLSLYDVYTIVDAIKEKYDVTFDNDICMATTMRQEAVIKQPDCDLLIVVGDSLSSNTAKLKSVSLHNHTKAVRIETLDDLDIDWLKDIKTVNVTSGASTPKAITEEVISFLKAFDSQKKETWHHVSQLTHLDILES